MFLSVGRFPFQLLWVCSDSFSVIFFFSDYHNITINTAFSAPIQKMSQFIIWKFDSLYEWTWISVWELNLRCMLVIDTVHTMNTTELTLAYNIRKCVSYFSPLILSSNQMAQRIERYKTTPHIASSPWVLLIEFWMVTHT